GYQDAIFLVPGYDVGFGSGVGVAAFNADPCVLHVKRKPNAARLVAYLGISLFVAANHVAGNDVAFGGRAGDADTALAVARADVSFFGIVLAVAARADQVHRPPVDRHAVALVGLGHHAGLVGANQVALYFIARRAAARKGDTVPKIARDD